MCMFIKIIRIAQMSTWVLVSAEWCASCKTIYGIWNDFCRNTQEGRTAYMKDIEKDEYFCDKYVITKLPTLLCLRENGDVIAEKYEGADKIRSVLQQHIVAHLQRAVEACEDF